MMRVYFFDASAIVKLVVNEKGSHEIRELCQTPEVVRTTWLCLAESYGVIKRKWIKKELDHNAYVRKLFSLQRYVQRRIKILGSTDLRPQEFDEVKNLLAQYSIDSKHSIDFSDALHIAIVKRWRVSRPVFVACDKKLLCAAICEGLTVWNPEFEPSFPR